MVMFVFSVEFLFELQNAVLELPRSGRAMGGKGLIYRAESFIIYMVSSSHPLYHLMSSSSHKKHVTSCEIDSSVEVALVEHFSALICSSLRGGMQIHTRFSPMAECHRLGRIQSVHRWPITATAQPGCCVPYQPARVQFRRVQSYHLVLEQFAMAFR